MASRREKHQEDVRLRVMRLIDGNPEMSTRQVVDEVCVSTGFAYYVLTVLVEKGFVKLSNCKNKLRKVKYPYPLAPKGIRKKSLLAPPVSLSANARNFKILKLKFKRSRKGLVFLVRQYHLPETG